MNHQQKRESESLTAAAICFGGCIILAVVSYLTVVLWSAL